MSETKFEARPMNLDQVIQLFRERLAMHVEQRVELTAELCECIRALDGKRAGLLRIEKKIREDERRLNGYLKEKAKRDEESPRQPETPL